MAHKTIDNEELPYRSSMRKSQYSGPWYYRYKGAERINGQSIYKILHRTLEKNVGKSFDLAFSYFCKLVPKKYQNLFLNEFRRRYRGETDYIIDNNGNIQVNPNGMYKNFGRYKGPYKFSITPDKEEWHKKIEYLTHRELLSLISSKIPWYWSPITYDSFYEIPWRVRNQYEKVIVLGKSIEFESQRNSKFKQLKAERRAKKRKADREDKKIRAQKSYSFLTKSEQAIIDARKNDLVNRDRHGFDDMSFKNRKES